MEKMSKSTAIKMIVFKVLGGLLIGTGFLMKISDKGDFAVMALGAGFIVYAISFIVYILDYRKRKSSKTE